MIRTNRFASYPHEFKVEAVRLVRESGKSTREIATDLGVSVVSLNRWLKDPELGGARGTGSSGSLDSEERAELRRLRREVRVLREEREILKKAALRSTRRCNTLSGGVAWRRWVDQVFLIQESRSCGTGGGLVNQSVRLQWRSANHQALFLRFCGTTVV